MSHTKDEKGFNQIFENTKAAKIRKERRCDYMLSKINNQEKSIILEIGCGTGEGLKYISENTESECIGIDISKKFIDQANLNFKNERLSFLEVNFNDSKTFTNQIEYGKFDYIIGNGILHHLYYSLDDSLENLYKLLKPSGKIIFIEPNIFNPYIALIFKIPYFRKKAFLEPDEMAFSTYFIEGKLRSAKFVHTSTEIKDFLLPNIPEILINPVIRVGSFLEKTPIKYIAQSILLPLLNCNQIYRLKLNYSNFTLSSSNIQEI